jgi:hypothetical protein
VNAEKPQGLSAFRYVGQDGSLLQKSSGLPFSAVERGGWAFPQIQDGAAAR